MNKKLRLTLILAIAAFCGFAGWWIARDLRMASQPPPVAISSPPKRERQIASRVRPSYHSYQNFSQDQFDDGVTVEVFSSCRDGEVILRFPSDETYRKFLNVLPGSAVRLVGQIDRLRAMRLGFDNPLDLDVLLTGENIRIYNALPTIPNPTPASGVVQRNLLGFGNQVMPWLGVRGDHSRWGAGVKIAVLDSGVVAHPGLPKLLASIAVMPFPENPALTFPHGTAVASMISGINSNAPGVAPAAQLISIRVIDEARKTDAFAVATGLVAAIDAGAQLINISLGTDEDNPLLREAIELAQANGIIIVAAAGNSAQSRAAFPADYPGVISVGGVDARGTQLEFSNYGDTLALTAPGYNLNAASADGGYIRVSGTSSSAPLVTGAIAAVMSDGSGTSISASKAAEIVLAYTDEAGIPGPDSQYGSGILNLGRIMNRSRPGIVDCAITQQQIVHSADGRSDEIQVTLQNRGTTVLVNVLLNISSPAGPRQINATTLSPCAVQTFSIPINLSAFPPRTPISVTTTLDLGSNGRDTTPDNNQRTDQLISP